MKGVESHNFRKLMDGEGFLTGRWEIERHDVVLAPVPGMPNAPLCIRLEADGALGIYAPPGRSMIIAPTASNMIAIYSQRIHRGGPYDGLGGDPQ